MRAVVCRAGRLDVVDVPTPILGAGHLLLRVDRAGICGSDLHALAHGDAGADIAAESGYPGFLRASQSVVLGHEFSGDVIAYGPGCRQRWPLGTRCVAVPMIRHGQQPHLIGLSAAAPGAYAECVAVAEDLTMPVPVHVPPEHAALTEPLAVAHHAVRRSRVGPNDAAVVVGCGPIGLAVILLLKAAGVRTVVASDLSARRRALAGECGADIAVDPRVDSPWDAYASPAREVRSASDLMNTGLDAMRELRRVPGLPWWRVIRAGRRLGAAPRGPVVFECVGAPGILEQIITAAPFCSQVIVVGVCLQPDTFRPAMAGNKEIDLRFVFAYDPAEFRDVLVMMATGRLDPSPLVTGTVGLDGVADAFQALSGGGEHAKIVIDPSRGVCTG